ncbi:PaaI family thioesterase [Alsobacter sp. R-9]
MTPSAPAPIRVGVVPMAELTSRSGLDFLRGMLDGELPAPPICVTGGFRATEVEKRRIVFEGEPAEAFYNPLGTVHGGWISTILDSALGCAVHSMLEPGQAYTTVDLKVNFVRPLLAGTGPVRAEARIVHHGGRIATSEARLLDARDRLVAHATSTCLIMAAQAKT